MQAAVLFEFRGFSSGISSFQPSWVPVMKSMRREQGLMFRKGAPSSTTIRQRSLDYRLRQSPLEKEHILKKRSTHRPRNSTRSSTGTMNG